VVNQRTKPPGAGNLTMTKQTLNAKNTYID
jgi:hypothetical protein